MPLIIDTNCASHFNNPHKGKAALILKFAGRKRISISAGGMLLQELYNTKIRDLLMEMKRVNVLKIVEREEIVEHIEDLRKLDIKTNDIDILAVARASRAQLLYTSDQDLIDDFTNSQIICPKGRVIKPSMRLRDAERLLVSYGT